MSLYEIKKSIWAKVKRNEVNLQVAADKCGVKLPITDIREAEKLLLSLDKRIKRKKATIDKSIIARYNDAHKEWFKQKFPLTYKDGHYLEPKLPDTGTSNGLTSFVVEYLTWCGYRATRISVEGRVLTDGTRIRSSTRKGSADVSSTIRGKSVMWEIKIGKDKPSQEQLREQAIERKAGGEYEFIKTVEEFFYILDKIF